MMAEMVDQDRKCRFTMVSFWWILVVGLLAVESLGLRCAAADGEATRTTEPEIVISSSDDHKDLTQNDVTGDGSRREEDGSFLSHSNVAEDPGTRGNGETAEDLTFTDNRVDHTVGCKSAAANSEGIECGENSAVEDGSDRDASPPVAVKDEAEMEGDKSSTKLFSLSNVIKNLFSPVEQEFQEGISSDKEQTNITDASNITILGDNATNVEEDAKGDKNATDRTKKLKFNCTGRNVTENTTASVQIVNSTVLLDVLSFSKNKTGSDCVLVMFFAPWCQFCAKTAPHFNALGRAFPQLEVLAVDAVHFSNLNARFGTVAVPNMMLFHQSRSAIRFNHTERNFDMFVQFVKNVTGLEPDASVNISNADWEGPLPSVPTEETDYLLLLAWLFVITCSGWMFVNSHIGQCAINKVRLLWQEHQHIE